MLHHPPFEKSKRKCAPDRNRTCDPLLRRQLLYSAELRRHKTGAGDENRTRVTCLEGKRSTIELLPPARVNGILYPCPLRTVKENASAESQPERQRGAAFKAICYTDWVRRSTCNPLPV